jgi:transaldolase
MDDERTNPFCINQKIQTSRVYQKQINKKRRNNYNRKNLNSFIRFNLARDFISVTKYSSNKIKRGE